MPSAAFARAAWVNRNNWMNFLFLSQNVATKGDSARYPYDTSGSHRRQDSRYLSDPSRRIHDPDSGPRTPLCRLTSVRFDAVSRASARTSPWGGFFVPVFPRSAGRPARFNDPVPTIQENDMAHRRFGSRR